MSDPAADWAPLSVGEAAEVMAAFPGRWWLSGGRALELYAGRSWRGHGDTDVGVLRRDAGALHETLADWEVFVAARGRLRPWTGAPLEAAAQENNLWCRRRGDRHWRLDVPLGSGDDGAWAYRRDPALRVPWSEAVLTTADGVPFLAPELQLLFKSAAPRPKDHLDAREVVPELAPAAVRWLRARLPQEHAWQVLLAGA